MRSKTNDQKHINLLVTIDDNYLLPLITMLKSYSRVHKKIKTDVYLVHSKLEEKDIDELIDKIDNKNINIHSIKTSYYFSNISSLERFQNESFSKLMAFYYLPNGVKKCLYLSPNVFIRKSLLSLYNMDLDNNYIIGTSHTYGIKNIIKKVYLRLKNQKRYLDSSVMLMNIQKMRKDFSIEKITEHLEEVEDKLVINEQDLINILYGKKIILLDEKKYNLDEKTFKRHKRKFNIEAVRKETAIINYNGKYRPWLKNYKGKLNRFYPILKNKGEAPVNGLKKHLKSFRHINKAQKVMLFSFISFVLIWLVLILSFGKEFIVLVSKPDEFKEWLNTFGIFDEVIFIVIRIAQTVVKFMATEPFEIASGYVWGTFWGMVYCLIGNTIGTVIILFLTRKYGKKVLEVLLPIKNLDVLRVFKKKKNTYLWLFILYLIPGTPKDTFTYFVGMLPIKTIPFLIITGIAKIPSIISSTLCGATLADKQYLFAILIVVITLLLSVLGAFLYKKFSKK